MEFGIAGWTLHHRSVDMSGLQPTALNLPDVGGVNPVDKISVPFSVRIEVGSKHAVYENIDDIAEAKEEIKMEALQQERKNVLGPYSFKSGNGTIPILISLIRSF